MQTLFAVTILLVAALFVYFLMRLSGCSASQRHAVLLATLGGTLALPLVTPLVPYRLSVKSDHPALSGTPPKEGNDYSPPLEGQGWSLEGPSSYSQESMKKEFVQLSATLPSEPIIMSEPVVVEAGNVGDSHSKPPRHFATQNATPPSEGCREAAGWSAPGGGQPTFSLLLFFAGVTIWCLGTACFPLRFLRSWIIVQKILNKTMPGDDPEFTSLLKRHGITSSVELRWSEVGVVPFTQGVTRPVVVLPATADRWTAEERRAILTHELAHVRRRDVLWQSLAELCRAIYWFHPLVWLTVRQLRIEREIACDDLVLLAGEQPPLYANLLTKVAAEMKKVPRRSVVLGCTVAMARSNEIKGRVAAIMNSSRRRKPLGKLGLCIVTLCACLGVTLAAMLTPAEEKPKNDTVPQEVNETAEPVPFEEVANVVDLTNPITPASETKPLEDWDASIKIKVVDSENNPTPFACIKPIHWLKKPGGGFNIPKRDLPGYTDENGELTCWYSKSTTDHLSFQIEKPGYRSHSTSIDVSHLSNFKGHKMEIMLKNALVVCGTVVDADTKEPIKDFCVDSQDEFSSYSTPTVVRWRSESGKFMASFAKDSWRYAVGIRATGYVPQSKDITDNEAILDFELKKSVWGSAEDPDKPMVRLVLVDENDQPIPHVQGSLFHYSKEGWRISRELLMASTWNSRLHEEQITAIHVFTSDANGVVMILLPKQDDLYNYRIQINTPGYTPYAGLFDEGNLTAELVVKLPSTRTIGGVIKDSQGNPI